MAGPVCNELPRGVMHQAAGRVTAVDRERCAWGFSCNVWEGARRGASRSYRNAGCHLSSGKRVTYANGLAGSSVPVRGRERPGGMATVYQADDLKHERRVAVEVLKPELAAVLGLARTSGSQ
jgi:hypothetical protein